MVVGGLHPTRPHLRREVGPAAGLQIHHEKGHVVGDVDPAERRAELDRVEGSHPAVMQHQISQMQVTMAFPHPACGAAAFDDRAEPRQPPLEPAGHPLDPVSEVGPLSPELIQVDRHCRANRIGGAPGLIHRRHSQALLQFGDLRSQPATVGRGEPPRLEPGIEPIGLVKLDEFHGPLDRPAGAGHSRLVDAARDRHRPQIEVRRKPSAHANLLLTEVPPLLQRGVVEEAEISGLLQLVDKRPGEEYPGDVGFDHADRTCGMRIAGWIAKSLDEPAGRRRPGVAAG
jgi:hypothetical protein